VDVIKSMEKHLSYQWIIAITHNVSNSHNYWKSKYEHTKKGKEWKISWKPLLVFSKGEITNTVNQLNDCMQSVREKDFHEWQQSIDVPDYFLPLLLMKNEIVLDPMAGTGTTGVSALKNGLRFIGIEKEKDTFDIMDKRVSSSL
ncbi:MAG: site-specific DNA-methyltransferase, partial [Desulfobacteraceae bacterium]|nr:site-specific DNA-methyltransferase [Desulfobacteraceae bacterium]